MAFGYCRDCTYCRSLDMKTFNQVLDIHADDVVQQIVDTKWFCMRHAPTKYLNDNDSIKVYDLFVLIDSTLVCSRCVGCGEFEPVEEYIKPE